MPEYYKNSLEHIYDELALVDILFSMEVAKFRIHNKSLMTPTSFQGLYVTEKEVDNIIKGKSIKKIWYNEHNIDDPDYINLLHALKSMNESISRKVKLTLEKGIRLNLIHLINIFNLSDVEKKILCICLAAQIDLKYERLFAYLQNNVTKKNPRIDLILNLVSNSLDEKVLNRALFLPNSNLFKNKILQYIVEEETSDERTLIARQVELNERISSYILGSKFIDNNLSIITRLYSAINKLDDLIISDRLKNRIKIFIDEYKNNKLIMNNIIFSLFGHDKSNKLDIAAIICREIGLELIVIDISLIADLDTSFHDILDLVFRESLLIPAGVYFSNIDFLFNNEEKEVNTRKLFLSILNGKSRLSFVSTENSVNALGNLDNQQLIEINFPVLEYNDRLKSWQKNLSKIDSVSKDIMLNELAVKFKFTDEQIKNAIYIAKNNAAWREGDKGKLIITIDDLYQGCYAESSQKLKELSQKIIPKYKLEDIILPEDEKSHINEIINYVKNKYIVLDKWGFSKKLSLGKGLCVLFYGPTGTGKTMSSEILANELKMELFRVDLSTIVSKYVGETEKNLSRIFDAAEMSNAILFFDEADAIFGKRSEIKDAHDRYANIEVGYLLQKIDEYTGVVVLSTNFIKNIDDAFLRRLQFIVHYPFPDVQYRKNIWQKIFPKEMPIDKKSINYDFLAEKIKFAGGNIKNIALLSAFLAAEKNESVTMNHIMLSAKREFQKLNKEWEYSDVMKEYKQIKIVSK